MTKELKAEGCTFKTGGHGVVWIDKCNDTAKADQWRQVDNELTDHLLGPIFADVFGGVFFICVVIYACFLCKNRPTSYLDLPFNHLTPAHHAEFFNIKNLFPSLNENNFPKINDIVVALELLIAKMTLPAIMSTELGTLKKEYLAITSSLDAEITKLLEYKDAHKILLSAKLTNGQLKVKFRNNIYRFFRRCEELRVPESDISIRNETDDIEVGLRGQVRDSQTCEMNELSPLLVNAH